MKSFAIAIIIYPWIHHTFGIFHHPSSQVVFCQDHLSNFFPKPFSRLRYFRSQCLTYDLTRQTWPEMTGVGHLNHCKSTQNRFSLGLGSCLLRFSLPFVIVLKQNHGFHRVPYVKNTYIYVDVM
jgi:hypothetical protein